MKQTWVKTWLRLLAMWCAVCVLHSDRAVADDEDDSEVVKLPSLEDPEGDGYVPPKVFSDKDKQATCKRYDNKYLSYYDKIYLVESCKLREILSHEVILEINLKQYKITPVDSDVVAKLESGKAIYESSGKRKQIRPCKQLNNKYVTFTYTDVYYVQKCEKRAFPDWASFIEHRKKLGRLKDSVLALSWKEFSSLKQGEDMKSIIDEEFARLLSGDAQVDVIPVDEACSGVDNRDVSYLDKIYRIEKCRKREYDPQAYLKAKLGKTKLKELSSEQWLSLPNGIDMPLGRAEKARRENLNKAE